MQYKYFSIIPYISEPSLYQKYRPRCLSSFQGKDAGDGSAVLQVMFDRLGGRNHLQSTKFFFILVLSNVRRSPGTPLTKSFFETMNACARVMNM